MKEVFEVPLVGARDVVTGTAGAPVDIANLGRYLWQLPTGAFTTPTSDDQPFTPWPGGQQWMNTKVEEWTGLPAEPPPGLAGAPARIASTVGTFAAPGLWFKGAVPILRRLGLPEGTIAAIRKFVSPGTRQDVGMGVSSGLAGETMRQGTDNPWLVEGAKAGGALLPALAHGGVSMIAKPYQREQAVRTTEEAVEGAERLGHTQLQRAAQDVQTAKDLRDLEVSAAQQARRAAVDPATGRARTLQDVATTQTQQLTQAEGEAAARVATAQAQAEQWKLAAHTGEQRAKAVLGQTEQEAASALTPLAQTLEKTGPPEGTLATGQAIQEQVQASGEAATRAAAEGRAPAYKAATKDIGPVLENQGLIDLAKADFAPQFAAAKTRAGADLDEIERIIATEARGVGGVPTENFRSQLASFVDEALTTPGTSLPDDVLGWAEMGLSAAQKKTLKGGGLARAKQALALAPDEAVDFSTLRGIDRNLGAQGRGGIVGTMPQGKSRAIKDALNNDFDTFFHSDVGTGLGPEFQARKTAYRDFRTNFDKSILGPLLDERAGHQAQDFITFLHGGNAKTNPQLAFIMDQASPETRMAISAHMASHMAKQSLDAAGNLNPKALQGQMTKLRRNGTFEMYFDDAQQRNILDTVQNMTAKDLSVEPELRKAIAKAAPEKVPALVFKPGEISMTDKFRSISTPPQYQEAVRGWAADLKARLPGMDANARARELAPMLRKHDGVSQLDRMFEHMPGVADAIADMVTQHRAGPGRVVAAKADVAQRTEAVTQTQATGATHMKAVQEDNAKQLVEVRRLADEADAAYRTALKEARDARAAGSDVTRQTREDATNAVKEAQRTQRATKMEVERETQAAKDRMQEARKAVREPRPGAGSAPLSFGTVARIGSLGAGLEEIISGLATGNTYRTIAGSVLVGLSGAHWATSKVAQSDIGQRFLRSYAPKQYGPRATAFAAQVLGQAATEENAPLPTSP